MTNVTTLGNYDIILEARVTGAPRFEEKEIAFRKYAVLVPVEIEKVELSEEYKKRPMNIEAVEKLVMEADNLLWSQGNLQISKGDKIKAYGNHHMHMLAERFGLFPALIEILAEDGSVKQIYKI
jgi:hypothetical protein